MSEKIYTIVNVRDFEQDLYGILQTNVPLSWEEIDNILKESNQNFDEIEENSDVSKKEMEAFNNGRQHYFVYFVCENHGWTFPTGIIDLEV